jgi:hypothetical protein
MVGAQTAQANVERIRKMLDNILEDARLRTSLIENSLGSLNDAIEACALNGGLTTTTARISTTQRSARG